MPVATEYDPGEVETALLAAGGRLRLNPLQPASDAGRYAGSGSPKDPPIASSGAATTKPAAKKTSPLLLVAIVAAVGVVGFVAWKRFR